MMDQDTINGLLFPKMILLPQRYNFQSMFFGKIQWKEYDDSYRKELVNESLNAVIIHYTALPKPWHFRYTGGFCQELWDEYRIHSFWRNCRIRKPGGKFVKHLVKRVLFPSLIDSQVRDRWVILQETKQFYNKSIVK